MLKYAEITKILKMNRLEKLPKIAIPLFDCGTVYLCRTRNEWQQAHRSLGAEAQLLDRCGSANTFRSLTGDRDIYLLGIFDNNVATLAHESAHLVFDICETVGVDVERGRANETFCHLLDTIVAFASEYLLTGK